MHISGNSVAFTVRIGFGGGPAPLIATAIFARYHSGYAIAGYILFCALVSLASTWMLNDYTNKDISAEYDRV